MYVNHLHTEIPRGAVTQEMYDREQEEAENRLSDD